ncbi:MAG: hypothetical protein H0T62_05445 [Parachlamydiaceae bacterium]|nr:hypothetical protein [Parachlamydiaceae bacterium]
MEKDKDWKYVVTPGFVARLAPGKLEIRRLDSDQWESCYDPAIHEMVTKDGSIVSEEYALEAHEIFKKSLL